MPELKVPGGDRSAVSAVKSGQANGASDTLADARGTSVNAETLSALMDDSAQDLELRRLLRGLGEEPELGGTWYRYQLARAALRGESLVEAPDFAARVQAAIADDPVATVTVGGWKKAVGSFAVAASVTVAVVFGGQQLALVTAQDGSQDGSLVSRVAPLPVGVVNTTGAVPVRASFGTGAVPTLQPADRTAYRELARQRLRLYSQEHAEHASLNTPQGMVPFARVPIIKE